MNPRTIRFAQACFLLLAFGFLATCNKTRARSFIGGPCSIDDDANPFYECDPAYDLICMDNDGDGDYHCRTPCRIDPPTPCEKGDVCCPGDIDGDDLGFERGCTPKIQCPLGPNPDAAQTTDTSSESTGGTLDSGK